MRAKCEMCQKSIRTSRTVGWLILLFFGGRLLPLFGEHRPPWGAPQPPGAGGGARGGPAPPPGGGPRVRPTSIFPRGTLGKKSRKCGILHACRINQALLRGGPPLGGAPRGALFGGPRGADSGVHDGGVPRVGFPHIGNILGDTQISPIRRNVRNHIKMLIICG